MGDLAGDVLLGALLARGGSSVNLDLHAPPRQGSDSNRPSLHAPCVAALSSTQHAEPTDTLAAPCGQANGALRHPRRATARSRMLPPHHAVDRSRSVWLFAEIGVEEESIKQRGGFLGQKCRRFECGHRLTRALGTPPCLSGPLTMQSLCHGGSRSARRSCCHSSFRQSSSCRSSR